MTAYNFSNLNRRDKRVYAISDINLSTRGIPVNFLIIAVVLLAISCVINIPIGLISGNHYFSPFTDAGDINTYGIAFVYGLPVLIAYMLYNIKIQSYRLIELLWLYLKPKPTISVNGKKITSTSYSFNAFLEQQ